MFKNRMPWLISALILLIYFVLLFFMYDFLNYSNLEYYDIDLEKQKHLTETLNTKWERRLNLFVRFEAIVMIALGFVFGREVGEKRVLETENKNQKLANEIAKIEEQKIGLESFFQTNSPDLLSEFRLNKDENEK